MKKILILNVLVMAALLSGYSLAQKSAVTYTCTEGRLGDQLMCYVNARWVAYKYNLPFCYRPFKGSEKFSFNRLFNHFDMKKDSKKFAKEVTFSGRVGLQNSPEFTPESNTLYIVPYDKCSASECDQMWNDEKFLALLGNEIASVEPIKPLQLPKDKHVVAVHVRSGIEHDRVAEADLIQCPKYKRHREKRWPDKFLPYAYYVEQIERLSQMLNNEPLYIHIFGDSPDLNSVSRLFQETLNNPSIEFGFRSEGNGSKSNVFEDLFGLAQCEYLIRPNSSFSMVAEKIGLHKISISPHRVEVINNKSTVTQIEIRTRSGYETKMTVAASGNFDLKRLCEAQVRIWG